MFQKSPKKVSRATKFLFHVFSSFLASRPFSALFSRKVSTIQSFFECRIKNSYEILGRFENSLMEKDFKE
jgi:hypothetical protein